MFANLKASTQNRCCFWYILQTIESVIVDPRRWRGKTDQIARQPWRARSHTLTFNYSRKIQEMSLIYKGKTRDTQLMGNFRSVIASPLTCVYA